MMSIINSLLMLIIITKSVISYYLYESKFTNKVITIIEVQIISCEKRRILVKNCEFNSPQDILLVMVRAM
jgi:hypothetical protein